MPEGTDSTNLTEVLDAVAGLVERPGVELESDDGEDQDGEHDEKADLHQRRQGLENGLEDDLETCGQEEFASALNTVAATRAQYLVPILRPWVTTPAL
jgi:hypothetical protein